MLIASGHRVRALVWGSSPARVEAAGCEYIPIEGPTFDLEARSWERQADDSLFVGRAIADLVLEQARRWPADAVIVDCWLRALCAAPRRPAYRWPPSCTAAGLPRSLPAGRSRGLEMGFPRSGGGAKRARPRAAAGRGRSPGTPTAGTMRSGAQRDASGVRAARPRDAGQRPPRRSDLRGGVRRMARRPPVASGRARLPRRDRPRRHLHAPGA